METLRGLSGVSPWHDWKGFALATHRFDGWNNSCLFCQWRRWECWCTLLFVSCLRPISSLTTKSRLLSPFKMGSVRYSQLAGEEPLSATRWYDLLISISICNQGRYFFVFVFILPLPKCLHTKASPRIIWPHRSIHPHPVSDVGPVPPAAHSTRN